MSASVAELTIHGHWVIEPLTARERTIVELLPTHLSYGQIGGELFVSVNTVKSNVKSIYRKLGVTTRFDAVAVARELFFADVVKWVSKASCGRCRARRVLP